MTWAALWYLVMGAQCLLILKLIFSKFYADYPAFVSYLLLDLLRSLALLPFPRSSWMYGQIWGWSEPVLCVLLIASGIELFHRTADHYATIDQQSFRSRLLVGTGIVAGAIAAASFNVRLLIYKLVPLVMVTRRYVYMVILLFTLISVSIFAFVRVPIKRNLVVHRWSFCALMLSASITTVFYSLWGRAGAPLASQIHLSVNLACVAVWLFSFRPEWNTLPAMPSDEELQLAEQQHRSFHDKFTL